MNCSVLKITNQAEDNRVGQHRFRGYRKKRTLLLNLFRCMQKYNMCNCFVLPQKAFRYRLYRIKTDRCSYCSCPCFPYRNYFDGSRSFGNSQRACKINGDKKWVKLQSGMPFTLTPVMK